MSLLRLHADTGILTSVDSRKRRLENPFKSIRESQDSIESWSAICFGDVESAIWIGLDGVQVGEKTANQPASA